jgi:hypothetical protein
MRRLPGPEPARPTSIRVHPPSPSIDNANLEMHAGGAQKGIEGNRAHKLSQLFCVRHIYLLLLIRMRDGDLVFSIATIILELLLSFDNGSFILVEETPVTRVRVLVA